MEINVRRELGRATTMSLANWLVLLFPRAQFRLGVEIWAALEKAEPRGKAVDCFQVVSNTRKPTGVSRPCP